jgi:hypothetical protein
MNRRWITRIGTGRAVALTEAGRDAFRVHLGLAAGERPEPAHHEFAR